MKLYEHLLEDMRGLAPEVGRFKTAEASMKKFGTHLGNSDFSDETREKIAVEILEIRKRVPEFTHTERLRRWLEDLSEKIYFKTLRENASLATMP